MCGGVRLILAAAVLAVFATVLPWGWTAGVHAGDGQVIVVLAAVGMFAVLRYREHRVGMMFVGEAVIGVIVASTAVVHFAWGERGPGLALLLLAGPLWFAGAAVPGRCIRWVAAAFAEGPLTGTTRYTLTKGAAGRYIVIWITALPPDLGEAHITEVRATRLATG